MPGMLDFTVNVRAAEPPSWLVERLSARLADLGSVLSRRAPRRGCQERPHGRRDGPVGRRWCPVRPCRAAATFRPRRLIVVDEALKDAVEDEPGPLAGESLPDVVVLRSHTEIWAAAEAQHGARRLGGLRAAMVGGLSSIGRDVIDGSAPFVLFTVPDAQLMRKILDGKGIAVRPHWPVLVDAIAESQ
jgi:histidinol-phosphate/aromatic aminotransferase/cobyric acid decarboxylase-like protein